MPQNPIINESMSILMMPRFWHGSRRMKNQRLKQSSINNPSLSGSAAFLRADRREQYYNKEKATRLRDYPRDYLFPQERFAVENFVHKTVNNKK
jgi:hypothetical protein